MELHVGKIHGSRDHKCDICNIGYRTAQILKNHIQISHSKDVVYKCDECDAVFPRHVKLEKHKRNHRFNRMNTSGIFNPRSFEIKIGMYPFVKSLRDLSMKIMMTTKRNVALTIEQW